MRVAVTGATGFLGTYVIQELLRIPDIQVVATSRQQASVTSLPSGVARVFLDLSNPPVDALTQLGNPDVVIHLAWTGLPRYMSIDHFQIGLPEQYRFVASLVRSGLKRILCAGTCFEYGKRDGELQEHLATNPGNPYGYAKDGLRRQLEFLQAEVPFELTWARLFYMYGVGQPEASIFTQLSRAIDRGDRVFAMSSGQQIRDYLPVEVAAAYLVRLAVGNHGGGVVNVCSGKPRSVRALVEQWIARRGWDIELELGRFPVPDYEALAFWGSRTRLLRLVGDQEGSDGVA